MRPGRGHTRLGGAAIAFALALGLAAPAAGARVLIGGPVPVPEGIVYVVGLEFRPESKLCDRVSIAVAGRPALFRDRFSDDVGTWVIAIRAPAEPGRYRVRLSQICRRLDIGVPRLVRASAVLTVR